MIMVIDLMIAYPKISIIAVSFVMTLFSTLVQKWLTDQKHIRALKERQKEIQKELKGCKDECLLKELNAEMLKLTGVMMKSSFKPLFVTFIPFILIFAWIRGLYGGTESVLASWFWWYLVSAIIWSMILRKVLKVA
jgi:uncharacterized membrane protein (DUF106 family)